jgi:hypothetical protein
VGSDEKLKVVFHSLSLKFRLKNVGFDEQKKQSQKSIQITNALHSAKIQTNPDIMPS